MTTQQAPTAEVERIKMERSLATLSSSDGVFASHAAFNHYSQVAALFAQSLFVPKDFQGSMPNCLIALDLAVRMRENPLVVFQNLYVVHGRPGFTAKYMIARAKLYAGWKSSVRWEIEQLEPKLLQGGFKNLSVTAWAVDENGERLEATVTMQMAIDDGWTKNTKYKSMPEQMLRWRSASQLINLYAPEVMLGIQTAEELEDDGPTYRQAMATEGQESMASVLDRVAASMPARVAVAEEDEESGEAEPDTVVDVPQPKAANVTPPAALADLVEEVEKKREPKKGQDEIGASLVRDAAAAQQQAPAPVVAQQADSGEPELAKLKEESVGKLRKLGENLGVKADLLAGLVVGLTRPGCYNQDELLTELKAEVKAGAKPASASI
jgi:hypothetical protein